MAAFSVRKNKVFTEILSEEVFLGTVEKVVETKVFTPVPGRRSISREFTHWLAYGPQGEEVFMAANTRLDAMHSLYSHYMRVYF